jgi:ankyrin repeat protein
MSTAELPGEPRPLDQPGLPDEPSLEQLRKLAKDLRRAVRAGDPQALAEVTQHHRDQLEPAAVHGFPLRAAQLVVARRHGFASWARLKRHVEIVVAYSRFPGRMATAGPVDPVDDFLRLACLSYTDDQPERWSQARQLLLEHPQLTTHSVHAAAAAADLDALRRILGADPAAASRAGGPYQLEPLLYLAYARQDPAITAAAAAAAARLLLTAGGDPNAGYLWHGMLTPFTVLTGVFGEGELGPVRQPRHPHSLVLARLLLEAGADPNDGQALYNRMFGSADDHLELLLEFGLGRGDGGPWQQRLGAGLDTPAELMRGQLSWAITHGMADRVRLLVSHGADVTAPSDDGSSLVAMAATTGHAELAGYLVAHGAPAVSLDPGPAFIAAALAVDRVRIEELQFGHPRLAAQIRAARPGLVAWAAASGRPAAVELLVELGFDVNARGRTDVPSDQPWQTALHWAAQAGDLDLARMLLRLGADPDLRDQRFDSTALGWARHFGQQPLIDLLEPITAPPAS